MNEEPYLLRIAAEPDDFATRLVYADGLEEHGDGVRAEFLRCQVARWRSPLDTAAFRRLDERVETLRGELDPVWVQRVSRIGFNTIRAMLPELEKFDPSFELFGSDAHAYRLNAPINAQRLAGIEAEIGAPLPELYRRFLLEMGDGGAGPMHGVFPLDRSLEFLATPRLLSRLSVPFQPPTAPPEDFENWEEFDPPGQFALSEIGCGAFHVLILAGPERGHIWTSTEDLEWLPAYIKTFAEGSGRRAWSGNDSQPPRSDDFLDWYTDWLLSARSKVSVQRLRAENHGNTE